MSRSTQLLPLIALLVLLVGGATLFVQTRSDRASSAQTAARVESLDQWVELTRRPEFRLLDSADLPDYFICVYYAAESSEVALCYRWKHGQAGPDARSFAVRDADGTNLQDADRWKSATALNPTGSIAADQYVDGMVVPIVESHRGEIHVELTDNSGTEFPTRSVYARTLHVGGEARDR